jgi:hypothetical protein
MPFWLPQFQHSIDHSDADLESASRAHPASLRYALAQLDRRSTSGAAKREGAAMLSLLPPDECLSKVD